MLMLRIITSTWIKYEYSHTHTHDVYVTYGSAHIAQAVCACILSSQLLYLVLYEYIILYSTSHEL